MKSTSKPPSSHTPSIVSYAVTVDENQPFVGLRGRPATNLRGFHINDVQPARQNNDDNVPLSQQAFPRVEGQTKMKYILRV